MLKLTTFVPLSTGCFRREDLDWGLRLCVALFRFWDMREHLTEGRAGWKPFSAWRVESAQKSGPGYALFLGALATAQGDYPAAEHFLRTEPFSL